MTRTKHEENDYSWADGPGKFEGARFPQATAYVYDLSLEGFSDTIGSADDLGWYGIVNLASLESEKVVALGYLGGKPEAAIITEGQSGFVDAVFYAHRQDAWKEWDEIESTYDDYYNSNPEAEHG